MSDYYGFPLPTPPGIQVPNVSSLYSNGNPYAGLPYAPASQLASQLAPGGALPSGAGIGLTDLPYAAEGAASSGGALSGLLGRVGPMASMAEMGGIRGIAGKALPPLLLSQLANAGISHLLPSTGTAGDVRQTLGDAATGAGVGAALGTTVFPGVGTATGALVGGAAGGLYGLADSLFGGGDNAPSKDDIRDHLTASATQLGLDPKQYSSTFDLLTENGADPKALGQQLAVQLLQEAQQNKQVAAAQAQQNQQRQMDQRFAMAMQSQAQEFFTPYVNNIVTSGLSQSEALKGLASQLPAPYRDVMMNQAQQALGQSQRLAGAYAAQSALIPGQFMAQSELKREQNLQQLQYQQAVIQAQQGKSSGGGLNAQLMQQLQGQSQQQPALTPSG